MSCFASKAFFLSRQYFSSCVPDQIEFVLDGSCVDVQTVTGFHLQKSGVLGCTMLISKLYLGIICKSFGNYMFAFSPCLFCAGPLQIY
jgi:hypothetical protein